MIVNVFFLQFKHILNLLLYNFILVLQYRTILHNSYL